MTVFDIEALITGRRDWRIDLAQQYEPVAARLLAAYERRLPDLRRAAQDLTDELDRRQAMGEPVGTQQLRSLAQFRRLIRQVETELDDFAALVRDAADGLWDDGLLLGADTAESLALALAGNSAAVVEAAWLRPTADTLARILDIVDSEAFRANWQAFGEQAAQGLADMLLLGTAQGKSPAAIARLVSAWWSVPYSWAENATRTAQLWGWRLGSHGTYAANSRIVTGWVWWSARDTRTCPSCWAMHGSRHGLDEYLNDHHRGRCTELPIVEGTNWWRTVKRGPDAFNSLSDADRAEVFSGNQALYRALQDGAVTWDDLSREYADSVYGAMRGAPSLVELLGTDAQQYYE
jgi:hypothetical protein